MDSHDEKADAIIRAAAAGPSVGDGLQTVVLDGLVVMKILKHSRESLPMLVTGQLLGLDVGGQLEVTNCFPFPLREEDGEGAGEDDGADYQIEMMKLLRVVNVDSNTVGWYQSSYLGCFISESSLDTQFNYQQNFPACCMVVFDPLRSLQGVLWLRALRLTPKFMQLYREQKFSQNVLQKEGFKFCDIFEELPIRISNPLLTSALIHDLGGDFLLDAKFERLDLSVTPFLEKNVEFMNECVDDFYAEQQKFHTYQRMVARQHSTQNAYLSKRNAENEARRQAGLPELPEEDLTKNALFRPIPEPSRLDALCFARQLASYCEQTTAFAGQGLSKLYVLEALQKVLKRTGVEADR